MSLVKTIHAVGALYEPAPWGFSGSRSSITSYGVVVSSFVVKEASGVTESLALHDVMRCGDVKEKQPRSSARKLMVQHSRGVAEHSSSLSSAGLLTLSRVAERHKIGGLRLVCQYLGETGIPVPLLPSGMTSTQNGSPVPLAW